LGAVGKRREAKTQSETEEKQLEIREAVRAKAQAAKEASRTLGGLQTSLKNLALAKIAERLEKSATRIFSANDEDLSAGKAAGLSEALLDRLALNQKRLAEMVGGVKQVEELTDPVGEVMGGWRRPNGLLITKVRVPFGVIGVIYEARPNVTVDAAALCLKSGNAVILRGGKEAINSNKVLVKAMREGIEEAGLSPECIQLIESTDRSSARELMQLTEFVDLLVPRGGAGLIRTVVETAKVPVIETGVGNCHIYVDRSADLDMAKRIVINAKCQRPSVCNAAETLLVDEVVAEQFLPVCLKELTERGVEIRGCKRTQAIFPGTKEASEGDWYEEYLALIMAVKVVDGIEEAIRHINKYGSRHSEAIVTNDHSHAQMFKEEVDAAAVFVNASTRFTDGYEFGFGAEIGISTQKLHARGPMGLPELTTMKYLVEGKGQIRE
jgi:glutamate-5-semialdehyde dehydrogenase